MHTVVTARHENFYSFTHVGRSHVVGCSPLYVQMISQKLMQLRSPNLRYKCSTMRLINFGVKRSQCLCQCSKRTNYCHCCIRKPCWIFHAVMRHCKSNASGTVFSPRVTCQRLLASGFSVVWAFALLWVPVYSSFRVLLTTIFLDL